MSSRLYNQFLFELPIQAIQNLKVSFSAYENVLIGRNNFLSLYMYTFKINDTSVTIHTSF